MSANNGDGQSPTESAVSVPVQSAAEAGNDQPALEPNTYAAREKPITANDEYMQPIRKRERAKEMKKRLIWTEALHRRFEDIVLNAGIRTAQPRHILHEMNVHGLTRENVASHLQKYRLRVMRLHNLSKPDQLTDQHGFALAEARTDTCSVDQTLVDAIGEISGEKTPADAPLVLEHAMQHVHRAGHSVSVNRNIKTEHAPRDMLTSHSNAIQAACSAAIGSGTRTPTTRHAPTHIPPHGIVSLQTGRHLFAEGSIKAPMPVIRDPDRHLTEPRRLWGR